jgi:multicomponent Na+:H+ antiporter subunit E
MMRAALQRGILFALLWWISVEGRQDAWAMGLLAVVAATAASLVLLPPGKNRISPAGLVGFLGFFFWQSARGGVQVAAIALRPRLDLRPTVLELSLMLPPGLPRALMAGVLGLMPGTVGVCLTCDRLRVHVLDERLPAAAGMRKLETHIARMFGVSTGMDAAA